MMKETYELELCGWPERRFTNEDGLKIHTKLLEEVKLPEGIAFPVEFEPDQSDVNNLMLAFHSKELLEKDFIEFCNDNKLPPDQNNPLAASRYLEYIYGKTLLWLHLPISEEGRIYFSKISQWRKGKELYILNPDLSLCVCIDYLHPTDPFNTLT